jgi:hypothetical protein
MSKRSIISDPRLVYALLGLVVTVPILSHAVLPVPLSATTIAVFDFINGLPANSLVVLSFDYSTSSVPELHPQAIVVTQHLFTRPVKIMFVAQWTDGPALTDAVLDAINPGNKTYGVDYVTLGWIPNIATIIGMTANIAQFFPVDTRGHQTMSLPLIKEFSAGKQASLVLTFATGEPGLNDYLQFWQAPFNIPVAVGSTASAAPGYLPFYNSHQIVGILISLRAAAEYEILIGRVGLSGAIPAMVALSASHLMIVIVVVAGNALFVLQRRKTKGDSK